MTSAVVTLVIYAYSSFTSVFGPGKEIVKNFEKTCRCKIELVNCGDAGSLIARVKLEGEKTRADVVLGIDGAFKFRIKKDLKWDAQPVAFDHGPLAFVYSTEKLKKPPHSLDDLLFPRFKGQIIIEDPRLSTTGLSFLLWVIKEKGEESAWKYFSKLKEQLKIVSPSWDLAYGIFKKGEVDLVLSYWTSPIYHILKEKREDIKAAQFNNGHYEQVEYVVVNPNSKAKKLANDFKDYLLTPESQKLLAEKNFMFPVKKIKLDPAYNKIGRPKTLSPLNEHEIEKNLDIWLKKWREIFS